ncbi:unnamed protein product [Clonostachys rosea]|uniref:Velvet domain-containing protein n=1 Tax=Bionectria ochroleuca TaxID=29856 RepID=A0ABY6UY51_BIOOC|nr:unnamed protein product [Clonostachys rosea]
MATPSAIPVDPRRDSIVRINRKTRGGRHLWYQLSVLQQPERARACGAGNKANSDRRPVDPPPVVELRIRHGDSWERGKDITFDYNASFFLYASLEQHRKISSGRMGTQQPPILTGVPASGMAYLDRPTAAGYFIFPDLSVRHEGQYRLSFSLFETTKEEIDFDMDPTEGDLPPGVDWRMEIKTNPFDVYSAKKFPGLMESTALSKEVADQGCRVRIRRDVRMRKRETKPRDHDRRDDDYSRRRNPTPSHEDPHSARARSMSNSSDQQHGPYGPDRPRRPQRTKRHLAAISRSVVKAAALSMQRLLVDIRTTTHHHWRRYLQTDLTHPVPNMQSQNPNNRLILQAGMGRQPVNLLQLDMAIMIADLLGTTFHHPRRSTRLKDMFAMTLNTPHILPRLSPAIHLVPCLVHNLILNLLRPKQPNGHPQDPSRLRI